MAFVHGIVLIETLHLSRAVLGHLIAGKLQLSLSTCGLQPQSIGNEGNASDLHPQIIQYKLQILFSSLIECLILFHLQVTLDKTVV